MGAAREPEDVAKAMRRIEDEAARMGVLVEDLLTLARLDEMRAGAARRRSTSPCWPRDAVDDARATAPDRRSRCSRRARARVTGDADQLRQVLANLLRNALVHTPAGTPIDVTVERQRRQRARSRSATTAAACRATTRARCSSASGAPRAGASAARTARASGSRSWPGSSTRHGGTVRAANAPDGGAAFAVGAAAGGDAELLRAPSERVLVSPEPPSQLPARFRRCTHGARADCAHASISSTCRLPVADGARGAARRPDVEIVVPVYNEAAGLERSIRRLHRFLPTGSRSAGGS